MYRKTLTSDSLSTYGFFEQKLPTPPSSAARPESSFLFLERYPTTPSGVPPCQGCFGAIRAGVERKKM